MTHPCVGAVVLKLSLLSTWGDIHYIGLNGVELYDETGARIKVDRHQLFADPMSINVLPSMQGDPRTADKLVDGVNETYNDEHMFLAPYSPDSV